MTIPAGTRLGPYEILAPLGAGGMGEVYRARDPRLGREVAVKVLPEEVADDSARLSLFEREARAVAALNHPNILTVHDIGTHNGTPYVVTELLEGETLRSLVSKRSPTVQQVLAYMLQAARGLEAAHAKGIVHRDLKPENLFLTTDGRVKVLDFGLAKLVRLDEDLDSQLSTAARSSDAGQVVGTILYMSPEQARGLRVDVRSDVFSFGVVLYELLARKHPFRKDTVAGTLTAIVEDTPARLEDLSRAVSPAAGGIVRRCLQKPREERYASGHDVAVALEAVLGAPSGTAALQEVEERSPYPGLSSFTEKDKAIFYGREEEARSLWERIRTRRLLAVIGPSGAGKTSFVRAGVLASRPDGWAAIICTPGAAPLRSLGQALGPELAGDTEALGKLAGFEDPETALDLVSRWRQGQGETLLVVDQFEELFTLNPPKAQERFAALLGRLVSEADVHVLLSLRDDFLIRCHEQPPLARVFEHLTPLLALGGPDLRRALEEPARRQGYRFEDEALVDEMVQAVEGARAALPLLAFAVSRLWEKRNRQGKLLTRAAYEQIGGVAGALAQHAEQTLERIGSDRQAIVREIFRNLVTSQWTRAAAEREELLSVWPDREAAAQVLDALIDARLLTSYEATEPAWGTLGELDSAPSSRGAWSGASDEGSLRPAHGIEAEHGVGPERKVHRIEIVHESLLKAWPRLVRWQAQDEEGAVLRDQLKQAAHLWEEKGRSADLLWTGTAYQEYELWRQRYAGALTATEDAFAGAMVAQVGRRRKRRRFVTAGVIAMLLGVLGVVEWSRQQTAAARDEAQAEARRAEASKLLAFGRLRLDDYPTAAVAYALASLEKADTPPARRFAVEALWRGPPTMVLPDVAANDVRFSPDGKWLATGSILGGLALWDRHGQRRQLVPRGESERFLSFDADSTMLLSMPIDLSVGHVWSVQDGRLLRTLDLPETAIWRFAGSAVLSFSPAPVWERGGYQSTTVRLHPLGAGRVRTLGLWPVLFFGWIPQDVSGTWLASQHDGKVVLGRIDSLDAPPRVLGPGELQGSPFFSPDGTHVAIGSPSGQVRLWAAATGRLERTLHSPVGAVHVAVGPTGRLAATAPAGASIAPGTLLLWDLDSPPDADPVPLRSTDTADLAGMDFHPGGGWLATANVGSARLWNLAARRPIVLRKKGNPNRDVKFTPDGRFLASIWGDKVLLLWPVSSEAGSTARTLWEQEGVAHLAPFVFDPEGRFMAVGVWSRGEVLLVPFDGGEPTVHKMAPEVFIRNLDSRGQRLAVRLNDFEAPDNPDTNKIGILDLVTGQAQMLDNHSLGEHCKEEGARQGNDNPYFLADGRLVSDGAAGLRIWNLADGSSRQLRPCRPGRAPGVKATADARNIVTLHRGTTSTLSLFDLEAETTRAIVTHGNTLAAFALDPTGRFIATGDREGLVRVGPLDGSVPHLLYGHSHSLNGIAFSPDGRWLASATDDAIRLWPMPDPSEPPFHSLPHEALLGRLRALTNLRVVPDEESEDGYRLEVGPFPGWKDVPTW